MNTSRVTVEEISASLAKASTDTEARKARIAALLTRHPDGFRIDAWEKVTLAGAAFWTNGRKGLTGGQLLELLGTRLVKAGALTESEFYS